MAMKLEQIEGMKIPVGASINISFWTGKFEFDLFQDKPHERQGCFKEIMNFPGIAPTLKYTANDEDVECAIKYIEDIKILDYKK